MSCGRPEDEGDEMPVRQSTSFEKTCIKCRAQKAVYSRLNVAYCLDCFTTSVQKRFSDIMFLARDYCKPKNHKEDATPGSLLLAMDGSLASRVALDILCERYFRIEDSRSKKQRPFASLELLYIRDKNAEAGILEELTTFLKGYGHTVTCIDAEDAYAASELSVDASDSTLTTSNDASEARTNLADYPGFTPTSRETIDFTIRNALITSHAISKGHKGVIFADDSTQLAARMLSAISKGQGWNIGELVAAADVPVPRSDVRIYRPLASVSGEEVRFFAEHVKAWPIRNSPPRREGIDGLVQTFIQNLESGFPSTVSTISRTAGKLGMRGKISDADSRTCPLCGLPSDPSAKAWREAASLSSLEGSNAPNGLPNRVHPLDEPDQHRLAESLCYGCLVPFWSQGKAKTDDTQLLLPAHTTQILNNQQNSHRADLRNEIKEFLL